MTKKMSQTIEFTERLMKFSSSTEILIFKPLLDARLQGFLNFNADTQLFAGVTDIEVPTFNHAQVTKNELNCLKTTNFLDSYCHVLFGKPRWLCILEISAKSCNNGRLF